MEKPWGDGDVVPTELVSEQGSNRQMLKDTTLDSSITHLGMCYHPQLIASQPAHCNTTVNEPGLTAGCTSSWPPHCSRGCQQHLPARAVCTLVVAVRRMEKPGEATARERQRLQYVLLRNKAPSLFLCCSVYMSEKQLGNLLPHTVLTFHSPPA